MTPIKLATDTALPPIKVGHGPVYIVITPDGKTGYVANGGSDTVTPIDIATDTVLPPVKVGLSGLARKFVGGYGSGCRRGARSCRARRSGVAGR